MATRRPPRSSRLRPTRSTRPAREAEKAAPDDKPTAERTPPTREPAAERTPPTREPAAERTPPTREPAAERTPPTREPAAGSGAEPTDPSVSGRASAHLDTATDGGTRAGAAAEAGARGAGVSADAGVEVDHKVSADGTSSTTTHARGSVDAGVAEAHTSRTTTAETDAAGNTRNTTHTETGGRLGQTEAAVTTDVSNTSQGRPSGIGLGSESTTTHSESTRATVGDHSARHTSTERHVVDHDPTDGSVGESHAATRTVGVDGTSAGVSSHTEARHTWSDEGTSTTVSGSGSARAGSAETHTSTTVTNEGHANGDHATRVTHESGVRAGGTSADLDVTHEHGQVGDDQYAADHTGVEVDTGAGSVGVHHDTRTVSDDDLSDGDIHHSDRASTGGHIGGVDASLTTESSDSFEGHGGLAGLIGGGDPGLSRMAATVVGDVGAVYHQTESQSGEATLGDHSVGQSSSTERTVDYDPTDGTLEDSRTDTQSVHVDGFEASHTSHDSARTDFNPLDDGGMSHTGSVAEQIDAGGFRVGYETHGTTSTEMGSDGVDAATASGGSARIGGAEVGGGAYADTHLGPDGARAGAGADVSAFGTGAGIDTDAEFDPMSGGSVHVGAHVAGAQVGLDVDVPGLDDAFGAGAAAGEAGTHFDAANPLSEGELGAVGGMGADTARHLYEMAESLVPDGGEGTPPSGDPGDASSGGSPADALADAVDAAGDAVDDAVDAAGDAVDDAFDAAGDAADDAVDTVTDFFGGDDSSDSSSSSSSDDDDDGGFFGGLFG